MLKLTHFGNRHLVYQAVGGGVDHSYLLFNCKRSKLRLFQHLLVATATLNGELGRGIQVGPKLGKSF